MTTEHDPLDISAEERTAARIAEEERLAKEKEHNELRWVMSTKQGRRFIHRQLSDAGLWTTSFDINGALMAFNEGRRNTGLKLLSDIMDACPDRYTEMLDEQREAKEKHDHRNADRRNKRA